MQNEILSKLKAPAIGLIVTGALNLLWGVFSVISNIYQFVTKQGTFAGSFEPNARYVGIIIGMTIVLISLVVSPIIIYGAVQMLKGHNLKLAKTAAILAIIPLTSCCFLSGIPFGIWALVVLGNPDINAFFRGEVNERNYNPPMPPSF